MQLKNTTQLNFPVLTCVSSMEIFTTSRWAITSMRKRATCTARCRCARCSTEMVQSTRATRPLRSTQRLTRVCLEKKRNKFCLALLMFYPSKQVLLCYYPYYYLFDWTQAAGQSCKGDVCYSLVPSCRLY